MRDVYLNHSSIITGLGDLRDTTEALLNNKSAVSKKQHFENELLKETGLSLFNQDLLSPASGRGQLLLESCISDLGDIPADTYVIWTGIKNGAETVESEINGITSPLNTNAYEYRKWVQKHLGLTGGGMEVNAACASSTVGAALAVQAISSGIYDHALVIGSDVVSRFVYFGFAALKAMTDSVCMPFDNNRAGLTLGDGAAALFFSAEKGSSIRVAGSGISNDANHITGPSRDGAGLAIALKQAIHTGGMTESDIQAFCAHGTGTRYNDSMEVLAYQSVFGQTPPPLFGVKGAIGHTLGAAGAIEIALCAEFMKKKSLPPTVACTDPESPHVLLEKTGYAGNNMLTSNSGFGGVNAALLLESVS